MVCVCCAQLLGALTHWTRKPVRWLCTNSTSLVGPQLLCNRPFWWCLCVVTVCILVSYILGAFIILLSKYLVSSHNYLEIAVLVCSILRYQHTCIFAAKTEVKNGKGITFTFHTYLKTIQKFTLGFDYIYRSYIQDNTVSSGYHCFVFISCLQFINFIYHNEKIHGLFNDMNLSWGNFVTGTFIIKDFITIYAMSFKM